MGNPVTNRRDVLKTGLAIGTAALAGCTRFGPGEGPSDRSPAGNDGTGTGSDPDQPTYEVDTVATGFTHPWGLAFVADDSSLLVTERPGRLTLLDLDDGTSRRVAGTPDVFASGQGGLLDVTVQSTSDEPWVYLTYAAANRSGASATHLARGRLARDESRLETFEVLHVAEPFVNSTAHFGSRVVIGPDDRVYMSVGDRRFEDFGPDHVAQDPTNELGATLRLNLDGGVPDDNPFVEDPNALDSIFSYGHRNPQGMAVHPETGAIWQAEHGERDGDEINVVEAGGNYGWPVASYACHYGTDTPVGDRPDERPEMVEPVHYWPCGSGGFPPSGMAFYDGDAFPAWQGDLFVGTLAGRYLGRFAVDGSTVTQTTPILDDRDWRIRAVEVAPGSGEIFVAVDAADAPVVRLSAA